jgi:hypothetical protein
MIKQCQINRIAELRQRLNIPPEQLLSIIDYRYKVSTVLWLGDRQADDLIQCLERRYLEIQYLEAQKLSYKFKRFFKCLFQFLTGTEDEYRRKNKKIKARHRLSKKIA